jgi:CSLREA domain-containing protein
MRSQSVSCLLLVGALVALLTLGSAGVANAATLTVTKTADTDDGVCDSDCSLREAVTAASDGDTITVPPGTYVLGPEITIRKGLTIEGTGQALTIVDGGGIYRHRLIGLELGYPGYAPTVRISNLTIQNTGNLGIERAGPGPTFLTDVTIRRTAGAISQLGGALTIERGTISDNTGLGTGGGGAGIRTYAGSLVVRDSTVKSNSYAFGSGGGILVEGAYGATGTAIVVNSTISGNQARNGGGLALGGFAVASLTNSTISGNTAGAPAVFGVGGGIVNLSGYFVPSVLALLNTTVTGNTVFGQGGGINNAFGGTASMRNTVAAGNLGTDCYGPVSSLGHNLVGTTSSCNLTAAAGDLLNVEPRLGPLQDNGGLTLTHALLPGSPAVDAGDDTAAPPTDQRGVTRPQGPHSDIGAYEQEVLDTTAPTITANATTADGSIYTAGNWTNQTVTVHYTCSDAESGIASCTSDQTFSAEGIVSTSGTATDLAGNSASTSFGPIQIDKTDPTITFAGNAGTYTVDQTVLITCSAGDALSGIASTSCPLVASGPATDYVGSSAVTNTTVSATAVDVAGNSVTAYTSFTVVVTADGICRLVSSLSTAEAICAQVEAIATAPNPAAKAGALSAFDGLISSQSGKTITAGMAELLRSLAHLL